jgi:hypothetical protein
VSPNLNKEKTIMMPYTLNLFPSTLLFGTPGGPGGGSGGGGKKKSKKTAKKKAKKK